MKKFVCILCICSLLFAVGCNKGGEETPCGTVSFTVVDGFSGLPVENAVIVLPEADKQLITDDLGKTDKVTVPVIYNSLSSLPKDKGLFTVLGFKEGYNDYALFYAQISAGQQRELKIYMFASDTPLSNRKPLTTVESPSAEWVQQLIDKYK